MVEFVLAMKRFIKADRDWDGKLNQGQTEYLAASFALDCAFDMVQ